jgi:hypothetical protein
LDELQFSLFNASRRDVIANYGLIENEVDGEMLETLTSVLSRIKIDLTIMLGKAKMEVKY